jgi:hypothetical protein
MVRVCVAEWSEPTRSQRAVILLLSHLLTLLGLVAWSVSSAAPATTAPALVPVPLTIHVPASSAPAVTSGALSAVAASDVASRAVASRAVNSRAVVPDAIIPEAAPLQPAVAPRPIAIVVNTSGHGVWLRRDPAGEGLGVWPDGAPMTIVGPIRAAAGRDWRQVRAPDGQVGWVAAELLAGSNDAALLGEVGLMTPGGFAPAAAPARRLPPTSDEALG